MNIVILQGTISSDPVAKDLGAGMRAMSFEMSTVIDDGTTVSVPVVWFDPDPVTFDEGDKVTVIGTVRRRFFRAGGMTVPRTDVVAEAVASDPKRLADALAACAARVAGLAVG